MTGHDQSDAELYEERLLHYAADEGKSDLLELSIYGISQVMNARKVWADLRLALAVRWDAMARDAGQA